MTILLLHCRTPGRLAVVGRHRCCIYHPASLHGVEPHAVVAPSQESNSDVLRAGDCVTSTTVIHLRTVPGVAGPAGWQSLTTPSEPGFVTYYMVTPR
jgi:hypothetical protein